MKFLKNNSKKKPTSNFNFTKAARKTERKAARKRKKINKSVHYAQNKNVNRASNEFYALENLKCAKPTRPNGKVFSSINDQILSNEVQSSKKNKKNKNKNQSCKPNCNSSTLLVKNFNAKQNSESFKTSGSSTRLARLQDYVNSESNNLNPGTIQSKTGNKMQRTILTNNKSKLIKDKKKLEALFEEQTNDTIEINKLARNLKLTSHQKKKGSYIDDDFRDILNDIETGKFSNINKYKLNDDENLDNFEKDMQFAIGKGKDFSSSTKMVDDSKHRENGDIYRNELTESNEDDFSESGRSNDEKCSESNDEDTCSDNSEDSCDDAEDDYDNFSEFIDNVAEENENDCYDSDSGPVDDAEDDCDNLGEFIDNEAEEDENDCDDSDSGLVDADDEEEVMFESGSMLPPSPDSKKPVTQPINSYFDLYSSDSEDQDTDLSDFVVDDDFVEYQSDDADDNIPVIVERRKSKGSRIIGRKQRKVDNSDVEVNSPVKEKVTPKRRRITSELSESETHVTLADNDHTILSSNRDEVLGNRYIKAQLVNTGINFSKKVIEEKKIMKNSCADSDEQAKVKSKKRRKTVVNESAFGPGESTNCLQAQLPANNLLAQEGAPDSCSVDLSTEVRSPNNNNIATEIEMIKSKDRKSKSRKKKKNQCGDTIVANGEQSFSNLSLTEVHNAVECTATNTDKIKARSLKLQKDCNDKSTGIPVSNGEVEPQSPNSLIGIRPEENSTSEYIRIYKKQKCHSETITVNGDLGQPQNGVTAPKPILQKDTSAKSVGQSDRVLLDKRKESKKRKKKKHLGLNLVDLPTNMSHNEEISIENSDEKQNGLTLLVTPKSFIKREVLAEDLSNRIVLEDNCDESSQNLRTQKNKKISKKKRKLSNSMNIVEDDALINIRAIPMSILKKGVETDYSNYDSDTEHNFKKRVCFSVPDSALEVDKDTLNETVKKDSNFHEDIYGRLRDKTGRIINTASSMDLQDGNKYIPPALQKLMELNNSDKNKQQVAALLKQLKGLINRLTDSNMAGIVSQVEQMYQMNSNNDMNNALVKILFDILVTHVAAPERLVQEEALFIAVLSANVGHEVGAQLLTEFVVKWIAALECFEPSASDIDSKELDNMLLFICHLYNFKVMNSTALYDILYKLQQRDLGAKEVDLILLILKNVGFALRREDPMALKKFITEIQSKACVDHDAITQPQSYTRVKFMLEVLVAIRNNNMSKVPNYDPTHIQHLQTLMKGLIRKGCRTSELKVSLQDLMKSKTEGKWWIVGSAWSRGLKENATDDDCGPINQEKLSSATKLNYSDEFCKKAAKLRMSRSPRINILYAISEGSENYIDAFEKLIDLKLPPKQEQEIFSVMTYCCIRCKSYNEFYAHLALKLCEFKKDFPRLLQFSIWDKFRDLHEMKPQQLANLAKFIAHLIVENGLTLSVFKTINFGEADDKTVSLIRQALIGILLNPAGTFVVNRAFSFLCKTSKWHFLKKCIRVFILKFVNPSKCDQDEKKMLASRVKIVLEMLSDTGVTL